MKYLSFLLPLFFTLSSVGTTTKVHVPDDAAARPEGSKPRFYLFTFDDPLVTTGAGKISEKLTACGIDVVQRNVTKLSEIQSALRENPPLPGEIVTAMGHGTNGTDDAPRGAGLNPNQYYLLPSGTDPVRGSSLIARVRKEWPDNPFYLETCFSGKCLESKQACGMGVTCGPDETSSLATKSQISAPTEFLTTLVCDSINECKYFKDPKGSPKKELNGEEINQLMMDELGSIPHTIRFTGHVVDQSKLSEFESQCPKPEFIFSTEKKEQEVRTLKANYLSEQGETITTLTLPEDSRETSFTTQTRYLSDPFDSFRYKNLEELQNSPDILAYLYKQHLDKIKNPAQRPVEAEFDPERGLHLRMGKAIIKIKATVEARNQGYFAFQCISVKRKALAKTPFHQQSPFFQKDFKIACRKK